MRAKREGVTPSFQIGYTRGEICLIKFDSPGHLSGTTAAGIIINRI